MPAITYISPRKALLTAAVVAATGGRRQRHAARRSAEPQPGRPLVFKARSALGADPAISPKLKVFIVDDPTVAHLDRFDPTLADWALVLEAIAARQPRAILVDKLFDSSYTSEEAASFASRIAALKTPVHAGAFVSATIIAGRAPMPLDRHDLAYRSFQPDGDDGVDLPITGGNLYGARAPTREALRLGHLIYRGQNEVAPFLRLTADAAIPVLGIAAFAPRLGRGLTLRGPQNQELSVPLTRRGGILVNMPSPDKLMARTYNMVTLVDYARIGKPITPVAAGDVVLILPSMYTGNTDWHPTPFGTTAGGFVHAAVVNSTITDAWLREVHFGVAGPLVGAALGLTLALFTRGVAFLAGLVAVVTFVVATMVITLPLSRTVPLRARPDAGARDHVPRGDVRAHARGSSRARIDRAGLGDRTPRPRHISAAPSHGHRGARADFLLPLGVDLLRRLVDAVFRR